MLEKLASLELKYNELTDQLSNPEIIADQSKFQKYAKAHSDLSEIVNVYKEYRTAFQGIEEARVMLKDEVDPEFKVMLLSEIEELEQKKVTLEGQLKVLLLPRDPNDDKSVIMEIRAGTGGEEAALFATNLFRMYARYAEEQGWKIDILDSHYTELGGIKELVFLVDGQGAFSKLKYESGVHRVQRIPSTESGGRIHTSAATVAVLPEAEEVDIEIKPNDLRIDTFCSSGPGGQCVNTTYSAIRIVHIPTGTTVSCQDQKSQHQNKEKALQVLRSRLLAKQEEERRQADSSARQIQVGGGDRSDKIRTYNFPQDRVTDHRINISWHSIMRIMDGEIEEIVGSLKKAAKAEVVENK